MSTKSRDERLEHVSQRKEGDNIMLNNNENGRNFSNSSISGKNISVFGNGDRPQMNPEVVKDIIMKDSGHTDEEEDSVKDLKTIKGHSNSRKSQKFNFDDNGFESVDHLKTENDNLKNNLYNIEDDLIRVKAEKDAILIRFNALNERINKSFISEKSPGRRMSNASEDCGHITSMADLNLQLRKQLDDDHREYKHSLYVQQQQQLKQAELVKRLQNRLNDLEGKGGFTEQLKNENDRLKNELSSVQNSFTNSTKDLNKRLDAAENQLKSVESNQSMDFESILGQLKEEKSKFANLAQINALLREQLDDATNANIGLREDVQKLTDDWQLLRNELDQKIFECKDDEATFSRYLASEQSRIKTLWNNLAYFKRQYNDIKTANEKDLHQIRLDVEHSTQSLRLACSNLDTNNRSKINQLEFQIESEKNNVSQLEILVQKVKDDFNKLEIQYQKQLETVSEKNSEFIRSNEKLKKELEDKDKTLNTLYKLRNGLPVDPDNSAFITEDTANKQLILDTDAVYQALRDIAQIIINDSDQIEDSPCLQDDALNESWTNLKTTFSTNSLHSNRSVSPVRTLKRPQLSTSSLDKQRMFLGKSPVSVADSICAAIRSAFQKRALQVQDLTSKLNSLKTNSNNLKHQLDDSENERQNLEIQLIEVRRQFDSNNREFDDIQRECERMRHTMAMLDDEKLKLEKSRVSNLEESKLDRLEIEKLKMSNYELKREVESATDNASELQRSMERQVKEIERLNKTLETTDGKNSKFREDILSLKETLNKISIEKEVVEQENSMLIDSLNKADVTKADYIVKLNQQRTEYVELRDKVHQHESTIHVLNKEITIQKSLLEKIEHERNRLISEKKDLEQEKYGIREELMRVENEKEELHQLKYGLHESIHNVEKSYETLQDDLSKVNCAKKDLENQISTLFKERNTLSSDILKARRDVELLSSAVQKLMKEKENLYNEKMEFISQVIVLEREIKENANKMFLLREDKEQIEGDLYESQQSNANLQVTIESLQANFREIESKRLSLFNEQQKMQHEFDVEIQKFIKAKDILQMRLNESEKEWNRNLNLEKKGREDDIERLISEREELRIKFTNYKDQMKKQFSSEIDHMRMQLNKDKEDLAQKIITIERERDDILLDGEMSKQHVINLMEQDKNGLLEKLSFLSDSLKAAELNLDRTQSECEARSHQDQEIIQSMNVDLKKFRNQLEQNHDHDREIKNLQNSYKDLENLRYQDHREMKELKSLLKIAEENRDCLRQDLTDSMARFREIEDSKERMRLELVDEKRNYFEEKKEVETLQVSNKDLRQKLKQLGISKIEQQRQVKDLQEKLKEVEEQKAISDKDLTVIKYNLQETEKARLNVRRELEDLRNHVKKLDTERGRLTNEVSDLQTRISFDENKEAKNKKENQGLKQKILESEAKKEELSMKLYQSQKIIEDIEEVVHSKEKANRENYDELISECKCLQELNAKYEQRIQYLTNDIDEKKSFLQSKDDKISAMDNTISLIDRQRKDAESRLGLIHSHFRKLIGFRQQAPVTVRNRSPSPQRRTRSISPKIGRTSTIDSFEANKYTDDCRRNEKYGDIFSYHTGVVPGSDIEPEAVRMALLDIAENIANLEKERSDLEIKVTNLTSRQQETDSQLDQALQRISLIQSNCGEIEEEKKGVDGRLSCAQIALTIQEETIQRNERERKALIDTVTKLEKSLVVFEDEKQYLQDRVDKLKKTESYYEEEKRGLIKAVDDAENRCTQLELLRRRLEGELQRLKFSLNDKDTENQILRDRIDNLTKQMCDIELKSQSLQLTINRLSSNLARIEEEKNNQKDKVHQLHLTINENQNNFQGLQEKLQILQTNLADSEHDRRILQERLQSQKHHLIEAKSENHILTDKLQTVQQELLESDSSRNELKTEAIHMNLILTEHQKMENDLQIKIDKAAMEKNLLTERINGLTASMTGLEYDRKNIEKSHNKVEKESHVLKKTLEKLEKEKNRSEEIVASSLLKRNEFDEVIRRLEDENIILQSQLQMTQNQLAEAEQCHAQRIMELSSLIKTEMVSEIERLKSALSSTEKTLKFREKSHRQTVKGLEEQITLLKDHLAKELKKRESYLTKSQRYHKDSNSNLRSIIETNSNNTSTFNVDNINDLDNKRCKHATENLSALSILKATSLNRMSTSNSPIQNVYFESLLTQRAQTPTSSKIQKSNSFFNK